MTNLRYCMVLTGIDLATPGSAVRHVTKCATRPSRVLCVDVTSALYSHPHHLIHHHLHHHCSKRRSFSSLAQHHHYRPRYCQLHSASSGDLSCHHCHLLTPGILVIPGSLVTLGDFCYSVLPKSTIVFVKHTCPLGSCPS